MAHCITGLRRIKNLRCLTRIRTHKKSSKNRASRGADALPCAPQEGDDGEVREIGAAWPRLSPGLRAAVLAIVRSVESGDRR